MNMLRPVTMAAVALLVLGAGCAPPEKPMPVSKTVGISASREINPYNEASNPVVLRLYQLSNRTAFEEAGFWELFDGSGENLAGVLLSVQSIGPIYPAESRVVPFDLVPETRYLGVFAEFADYESQRYSALEEINDTVLEKGVVVSISASGINIEGGDLSVEEQPQEARRRPILGFIGKLFGGKK